MTYDDIVGRNWKQPFTIGTLNLNTHQDTVSELEVQNNLNSSLHHQFSVPTTDRSTPLQ